MDLAGRIVADWGPMALLVGALITALVTRRNAKDTSALGWFTSLATELRAELNDARAENRNTRLQLQQAENRIQAVEDEERRKAILARIHGRWDEMMVLEVRKLNPDATIPDPPPLD